LKKIGFGPFWGTYPQVTEQQRDTLEDITRPPVKSGSG